MDFVLMLETVSQNSIAAKGYMQSVVKCRHGPWQVSTLNREEDLQVGAGLRIRGVSL